MTTNQEVRAGQVWADNDHRNKGRTLRIDAVTQSHAHCTILTNSDLVQGLVDREDVWTTDRRGKTTRIRLDRFRPTSTGYRLVEEQS